MKKDCNEHCDDCCGVIICLVVTIIVSVVKDAIESGIIYLVVHVKGKKLLILAETGYSSIIVSTLVVFQFDHFMLHWKSNSLFKQQVYFTKLPLKFS